MQTPVSSCSSSRRKWIALDSPSRRSTSRASRSLQWQQRIMQFHKFFAMHIIKAEPPFVDVDCPCLKWVFTFECLHQARCTHTAWCILCMHAVLRMLWILPGACWMHAGLPTFNCSTQLQQSSIANMLLAGVPYWQILCRKAMSVVGVALKGEKALQLLTWTSCLTSARRSRKRS